MTAPASGAPTALAIAGGVGAVPVWEAVLRALTPHARGRLIDFGGGSGILAIHMAKLPRVTDVTVADLVALGADAESAGIRRVEADLNAPVPLPGGYADVVVSCEVIEHLENPRAVAREWRRLLKPGGTLVMSTPNIECVASMLSFVVRGGFLGFTEPWYPAHITPLSALDVRHVLTEAGFERIHVGYTDRGRIPLTGASWQAASLGLLRGRRFSDNLVAVAHAPA